MKKVSVKKPLTKAQFGRNISATAARRKAIKNKGYITQTPEDEQGDFQNVYNPYSRKGKKIAKAKEEKRKSLGITGGPSYIPKNSDEVRTSRIIGKKMQVGGSMSPARSKPRTPIHTSTPIKKKIVRATNQKPTNKPKPTGPDYEGPYSIKGTAGPVNSTVSKVREILNEPPSYSPYLYQKKGGAIKKVTKTSLAKSQNGGPTGKQKRLEKRELKAYDKYNEARKSGSQKTGKLYGKLVDRQTKSIMAGVNTQYKKKGGAIKAKRKK